MMDKPYDLDTTRI